MEKLHPQLCCGQLGFSIFLMNSRSIILNKSQIYSWKTKEFSVDKIFAQTSKWSGARHWDWENYYFDARKSSNTEFLNFFGDTHDFLVVRSREKPFLQKHEIFLEFEKIWVARNFDLQIVDEELFSTENSQKT